MSGTVTTNSPEETLSLGESIGRALEPGDFVCLEGDLGAGKTALCQGICRGLSIPAEQVSSPTFAIVNEYSGDCEVLHFDFYRVGSPNEIVNIGWDDYLAREALFLVEWPEKGEPLLPEKRITISLKQPDTAGENTRLITIRARESDRRFDELFGH